jgi:SRSO17 transposase
MVSGLLMELDDHNCWTIAEAVGHRGPHRLQHLLSRAVWDDQHVVDMAAAWAVGHLDDGDAVLIVDEPLMRNPPPTAWARPASTAAPSAVSRCARWRSP